MDQLIPDLQKEVLSFIDTKYVSTRGDLEKNINARSITIENADILQNFFIKFQTWEKIQIYLPPCCLSYDNITNLGGTTLIGHNTTIEILRKDSLSSEMWQNKTFIDMTIITNLKFLFIQRGVIFKNCTLKGNFRFINSNEAYVLFDNVDIQGTVLIDGKSISGRIEFMDIDLL